MNDFGVYALIACPVKIVFILKKNDIPSWFSTCGKSGTFPVKVHLWLDWLDEESRTETQGDKLRIGVKAVNKLDDIYILYVLKCLSVKTRACKHESKHKCNLVDICTRYT